VDEKNGTMVVISKSTVHPNVPERSGIVRVREYWSVMHIKAVNGLDKPGVEFGLTYFDNPGLSMPIWILNYAATAGIPEFLNNVRVATRARHNKKIGLPSSITIEATELNQQESGQTTLPSQKSEILSQFFKQNFLQTSVSLGDS